MKVKQLIAKLKKMPQDLNVYLADHDHDHDDYEVSSTANHVCHVIKNDCDVETLDDESIEILNTQPDEWVIIHG